MAILGLQGVRGGTGVTSITAALAWALQLLGESVLAIDASPDNMLRFFFNTDIHHQDGWARALLDGRDWRDAGSISIYCRLASSAPAKEKMSTSCSPPWGR
ncbi:cell division protein [Klebsiella pneumoniae]|nr:cell division protein [Klebsiella pneumoniae]